MTFYCKTTNRKERILEKKFDRLYDDLMDELEKLSIPNFTRDDYYKSGIGIAYRSGFIDSYNNAYISINNRKIEKLSLGIGAESDLILNRRIKIKIDKIPGDQIYATFDTYTPIFSHMEIDKLYPHPTDNIKDHTHFYIHLVNGIIQMITGEDLMLRKLKENNEDFYRITLYFK